MVGTSSQIQQPASWDSQAWSPPTRGSGTSFFLLPLSCSIKIPFPTVKVPWRVSPWASHTNQGLGRAHPSFISGAVLTLVLCFPANSCSLLSGPLVTLVSSSSCVHTIPGRSCTNRLFPPRFVFGVHGDTLAPRFVVNIVCTIGFPL